jgi:hypothetical protein
MSKLRSDFGQDGFKDIDDTDRARLLLAQYLHFRQSIFEPGSIGRGKRRVQILIQSIVKMAAGWLGASGTTTGET